MGGAATMSSTPPSGKPFVLKHHRRALCYCVRRRDCCVTDRAGFLRPGRDLGAFRRRGPAAHARQYGYDGACAD